MYICKQNILSMFYVFSNLEKKPNVAIWVKHSNSSFNHNASRILNKKYFLLSWKKCNLEKSDQYLVVKHMFLVLDGFISYGSLWAYPRNYKEMEERLKIVHYLQPIWNRSFCLWNSLSTNVLLALCSEDKKLLIDFQRQCL